MTNCHLQVTLRVQMLLTIAVVSRLSEYVIPPSGNNPDTKANADASPETSALSVITNGICCERVCTSESAASFSQSQNSPKPTTGLGLLLRSYFQSFAPTRTFLLRLALQHKRVASLLIA